MRGKRSNFIVEVPAAPFFEFQIPENSEESEAIICDQQPDGSTAAGSEVQEIESWVNLGVLSMFIHRGSYSGCIYQPKINHRQLDIGNYTKESKEHSVMLLDTALGKNDFGFDKQSMIKIMPYTIKKIIERKMSSLQPAIFLCCNS